MASAALAEMVALLGKPKAVELYRAIVVEYTDHAAKHLAAAAAENPTKAKEAAFVGDVLARVKADTGLAQVLAQAIEDAPADGGRVR